MTRRRWLIVFTLFAAVVLAIVWTFLPRPVLVDVATVARGPMEVVVEEEGKTRVRDRYVVSAPVAGYVRRIVLEVGDKVEPGQVLAELEPLRPPVLDPRSRAEARARVAAAEAALEAALASARSAEAAAEFAEAELSRARNLHEAGLATREALERAETTARQARARRNEAASAVEVARHDLEAARAALRYSPTSDGSEQRRTVVLRAPAAGRILFLSRKSEGVVGAGEPLVEIGDPGAIEAAIDVLSADAVRIRPGMRVVFDRWGGDVPLEGQVRRVEPGGFTKVSALGVEEQRVLVIADFTAPREYWEPLGDGYRLEARFVLWEGEDVLQVPNGALFRRGDDWAVFAVEGGRARMRSITVGRRSGLAAQILSGLSEGDRVIVHPPDAVSDGVRVRSRRNESAP
jgi:HlyD family secretion protein